MSGYAEGVLVRLVDDTEAWVGDRHERWAAGALLVVEAVRGWGGGQVRLDGVWVPVRLVDLV